MLTGLNRIWQPLLRVDHQHTDRHEDSGKAQAERDQQQQPKADMAERHRDQQQHQRGRARDHSTTGAQRDQAAETHITLRNVAVPVRSMVVVVIVIMVMMMIMRMVMVVMMAMGVRSRVLQRAETLVEQ